MNLFTQIFFSTSVTEKGIQFTIMFINNERKKNMNG
jgi:hypothetical protein